ncbi:M20 family metallopeptidase [Candidatus Erwinia dacicola]|uniref:Peptidase M20 n=1 Tax=Candidatus Erwinia dacicola TaxID=252393 RepID=A0A1E7Z171_9GAMM|nr:M20 family metallopeptidase [Candidatus Erwinia dacicola]NJC99965.1 M20 family peptidase [Candidatus Erwinia dacicola]OFC62491.1 peptidase M20 [Candidatus Erwinia dacicola]RAP70251.1 peptidase M20/M25/M40 family protein [Candidatus Erwinia dacicola]
MKAKILFLVLMLSCISNITAANAKLSSDERVLINYIDKHKKNQLKLLENLVNINSGTGNRPGVEKVGELVRTELDDLGFKTQWVNLPASMRHAGSLVARHSGPGKKILIIGHLDTVFPRNSPFQSFTLSSDQLSATGPGVIDDKGGVVTILYTLNALNHAGKLKHANITVVLTGDEEQAEKPTSISRNALKEAAQGSDIALGFEFSLAENQLVTRRRGLSEWYLSSSGKPGHSSTIFQTASGDGAIYETARVLNSFRTTLSNIPGLTLNPSIILGGQTVNEDTQQNTGSASGQKTIIAAQTLVHGDLRFLSDKQKCMAEQKMHEIMETSLPLTSSQLIFNNIMPAMLEKNENRQLLAELSDISVTLGGSSLQAVQTTERGGADISYIAQYAAASLDGLGPWGRGTHSQNETLEVKSLPEVTKRAAIFISRHLD